MKCNHYFIAAAATTSDGTPDGTIVIIAPTAVARTVAADAGNAITAVPMQS